MTDWLKNYQKTFLWWLIIAIVFPVPKNGFSILAMALAGTILTALVDKIIQKETIKKLLGIKNSKNTLIPGRCKHYKHCNYFKEDKNVCMKGDGYWGDGVMFRECEAYKQN